GCGVATFISTSARSTSMSAACARRSIAATPPIRSAPSAAPVIRWTIASARRLEIQPRSSAGRPPEVPAPTDRPEVAGPMTRSARPRRVPPEARFARTSGCRIGLCDLPHRPFVAPPVRRRLIRDPRMVGAIGQAGDRVTAAEKEIAAAWIADRPAAGLLVQFQGGAALPDRDDVVDQLRFGLQLVFIGMRQRRVAPGPCAPQA